jgi:hypothetical protein
MGWNCDLRQVEKALVQIWVVRVTRGCSVTVNGILGDGDTVFVDWGAERPWNIR